MRRKYISAALLAATASLTTTPSFSGYAYLDDANNPTGEAINNALPFPRVALMETKALAEPLEQYSKYNTFSSQAYAMPKAAIIQAAHPEIKYFRHFSPRAYQGYTVADPCHFGTNLPFSEAGSATVGCEMFAGHWLYAAGTQLTQSIDAADTTVKVEDAHKITVGQYVVIYDAPAGSFRNAEHAKVVSKNTSTNTVVLTSRGYKSTSRNHSGGSIMASHVPGQGKDSRNWSYNLSLSCPRDSHGKTVAEVMADYLVEKQKVDFKGNPVNIRIDGILLDAEPLFIDATNVDVDNNLVIDDGVNEQGINLWGKGLDRFYDLLRSRFPHLSILGGTNDSRGASLSGTQMEGWPVSNGYLDSKPQYATVNSQLADYNYNVRTGAGPLHTHNLSKTPTKAYPNGTGVTSNAPFRFAFGLTLLDDGYYSQENSERHPDPWYDEYAVDVVPGSPTFGQAVESNPYNESAILRHRGWLGKALDVRYRLYDTSDFSPNRALVAENFEGGLNGWSGKNVNVNHTSDAGDGSGALMASKHVQYDRNIYTTSTKGPSVYLTKGTQYTFSFLAKASQVREMKAGVGSQGERFIIGTSWRRIVMSFTAPTTGKYPISFGVGRENSEVWIDSVYLFAGNADVFRRDFEHGIVVVNATPTAQTVNLGGTFRRIKGRQDSTVNNGGSVNQVTIPPHDTAILIRP